MRNRQRHATGKEVTPDSREAATSNRPIIVLRLRPVRRSAGAWASTYNKKNTYEITSLFGKGNVDYNLYGSGVFNGLKLPLVQTGHLFRGEVLRRLWWKIFVGPRFWTGQSFVTLGKINIENLPPHPPGFGIQNTTRALGVRMIRDTRRNQFFPTAGEKLEFTSDFFMQSLGQQILVSNLQTYFQPLP
jgi:hypothetical protein